MKRREVLGCSAVTRHFNAPFGVCVFVCVCVASVHAHVNVQYVWVRVRPQGAYSTSLLANCHLRFRSMECNSMRRLTNFKPENPLNVTILPPPQSTRACSELTDYTTHVPGKKKKKLEITKIKQRDRASVFCMSQWKHKENVSSAHKKKKKRSACDEFPPHVRRSPFTKNSFFLYFNFSRASIWFKNILSVPKQSHLDVNAKRFLSEK